MTDAKDVKNLKNIFTGTLICITLLSLALFFTHTKSGTGWLFLTFVLILATYTCRFLFEFLHKKKKPVEWFLSLAIINIFIVIPELALRVVDFKFVPRAIIQFGYPRPDAFKRFIPDKKLFWRYSPARKDVNSLGFIAREVAIEKPENTYRILYFGDSCTEQGYPAMAEAYLNQMRPDRKFECVPLAVAGYTSHQGRVLAERYGQKLDPDLAVIHYGWNDHWLAYGAIDSEKVIEEPKDNSWSKFSQLAYDNSSILQLIKKIRVWFSRSDYSYDTIKKTRVPLDQYRENLLRILKIFNREKVPVIFITSPTSHYRMGVPHYLVKRNYVIDEQSTIQLHKSYNQVVRNIAKHPGASLLDLETDFNTMGNIQDIFTKDGIHFTPTGQILLAKKISDFVGTKVLSGIEREP